VILAVDQSRGLTVFPTIANYISPCETKANVQVQPPRVSTPTPGLPSPTPLGSPHPTPFSGNQPRRSASRIFCCGDLLSITTALCTNLVCSRAVGNLNLYILWQVYPSSGTRCCHDRDAIPVPGTAASAVWTFADSGALGSLPPFPLRSHHTPHSPGSPAFRVHTRRCRDTT